MPLPLSVKAVVPSVKEKTPESVTPATHTKESTIISAAGKAPSPANTTVGPSTQGAAPTPMAAATPMPTVLKTDATPDAKARKEDYDRRMAHAKEHGVRFSQKHCFV
uniref:Conjugal transfer protein n=1 Tax=Panagrellus redivivus TaxID=6233 RepID=A0A7E4W4M7_PANRE